MGGFIIGQKLENVSQKYRNVPESFLKAITEVLFLIHTL